MMNKITHGKTLLIVLILLAAFSRIIPHPYNFSPLGAIGIFGAAYFAKKWMTFLVPILATWLSDLFINNVIYAEYYPQFTWFYGGWYWIYGTYALIALAGIFIMKKVTLTSVLAGALTSTAIFYLVTNFMCWPGSSYARSFDGLMACYAAGLPFLKGTLTGDLFYCGLLFGSFELAQRRFSFLSESRRY
jgi:hypothetical protein